MKRKKKLRLPSGEKGHVDISLTSRTWLISVMAKMVLSLQRMENAPEKGCSVEEGRVVKSWSPKEIVHTKDFDLAVEGNNGNQTFLISFAVL